MLKQIMKSKRRHDVLRVVCISILLLVPMNALRAQEFKKPEIKDIAVDDGCTKLLKLQSAKLEAAGAAKKLLAWTPLMTLAGETNAPHAAFSIVSTNWEELATSITDVDKLVFSVLATESLMHATTHDGNPKLKDLWKAMSDFYASRIPTSAPSVVGLFKGSMTLGSNKPAISISFVKIDGTVKGEFMVTSNNQGPCDNLKIETDGSISFSVGEGNQLMSFRGKISSDSSKIEGTFTSKPGNGNWSVNKE